MPLGSGIPRSAHNTRRRPIYPPIRRLPALRCALAPPKRPIPASRYELRQRQRQGTIALRPGHQVVHRQAFVVTWGHGHTAGAVDDGGQLQSPAGGARWCKSRRFAPVTALPTVRSAACARRTISSSGFHAPGGLESSPACSNPLSVRSHIVMVSAPSPSPPSPRRRASRPSTTVPSLAAHQASIETRRAALGHHRGSGGYGEETISPARLRRAPNSAVSRSGRAPDQGQGLHQAIDGVDPFSDASVHRQPCGRDHHAASAPCGRWPGASPSGSHTTT